MIIYHRIRNFLNFDILKVVKLWKFANFWNWTISEIWLFYEFIDNGNLILFIIEGPESRTGRALENAYKYCPTHVRFQNGKIEK